MRKLLLPLLMLSFIWSFAQTPPSFNGKQLVDVTTISPWSFTLRPAGWYRIAKIVGGSRGNATFELREDAAHSTLRFEVGVNFNSVGASSFTVTNHSYFGGPATFPKIRLLTGGIYDDTFLEVYVDPHYNDGQPFYAYLINAFADSDWTLLNWLPGAIPTDYLATEFATDLLFTVGNIPSSNIFSVARNGYVGIGTITPDTKFAVNGTIHSKEVKVDLLGWPDYVFKPTYQLPKLSEVKSYIDQNQHLPDMPSEAEVEKDGVNLGEMVKLQTKKIEELTLYLIEQNKEIKLQNIINQQLELRLKKLETPLNH